MSTPTASFQQHLQTAIAHHRAERFDVAEQLYRQLLADSPINPAILHLLGVLCHQTHRTGEAIDLLSAAVKYKPGSAEAFNHLAVALNSAGRLREAATASRRAIQLKPGYPAALINLGISLRELGEVDESIAILQEAIRAQPESAAAHENLAHALKAAGQIDAAIESFNTAIKLNPRDPALHSSKLYCLNYSPALDASSIRDQLREWDQRHALPLRSKLTPHTNDRHPHRRLRIGYVSSNFRAHGLAIAGLALFRHHDHKQVEVFCYSDVSRPDPMTALFREHADHWRPLAGKSDSHAADMIRGDGIDILVDLNLHLPKNRLLVFARKPAPVQVTMLGYPGSTGLETIDYRITDPYLDPPGQPDSFYSERSIRLPDSFWCYDPMTDDVPISELPALSTGHITFGCLNQFYKANRGVIELFANVFMAIPTSRLIMLCRTQSGRTAALEIFSRAGVDSKRIEFINQQPRADYLRTFNRIDIALDTLPYNGHTTTLDSLWMGVPVISLTGRTAVGRAGVSILTNLGLTNLIADMPEDYVAIATRLSSDLKALSDLRATLRKRMLSSPLMDAARFAGHVESACRTMWQSWCNA